MIQPREAGQFRYGDLAIWVATGQDVTVVDDFDARLVKVVDRGVVKYVPRHHLRLRIAAEKNLEFYDDWFEEAN